MKTEYVDRDVPVQAPLDPRLTQTPAEPGPPPFRCLDKDRKPTVCHGDELDAFDQLRGLARQLLRQIESIRGLQPGAGDGN